VDETMKALLQGVSGIARITQYDPSKTHSKIAGEVKDFDPGQVMDRKKARRIGRYAQFAVAAARQALDQSGLNLSSIDPTRIGTVVASGIADFPFLQEEFFQYCKYGNSDRISPFVVPRVATSMASGNIAIEFGLQGPAFGTSSACASGSHSIATAFMMLRSGFADVMLAGGSEAAICETFMESYAIIRALSTRNDAPEKASRPFDKGRDGFVMAEGCGILVMETLEHAKARGATILGEITGVGMSCDAHHFTANHPEGRGAAQAMQAAISMAGLKVHDIDYINAHGTSTPTNDPIETRGIKAVFGEHAAKVPVSSIKSMIGHSIGAAGAIEAIVSLECIRRNAIPPTINLDEPDPECDLDYVPHKARYQPVNTVLSNSFAFGGMNCALVFQRYEG
jgi:3-oxoacyl-[acyl-carrier-protein] synthase II